MSFKLDTRQFERRLAQYIPLARKDIADELNRRSANILMWAIKYTEKANLGALRSIFARSATVYTTAKSISRSSGARGIKIRKPSKKVIRGTMDGYRIANYRRNIKLGRRPTGNPPGGGLGGASMKAYIRKTFRALGSAVGYLKSGWIPALRVFKESGSAGDQTAKIKGKRGTASYGGGTRAKPGEIIRSYFYSTVNPRTYARGPVSIDKRLNTALQKAIDHQTRDMMEYINDRIKKRADKSL
ncbi:MAG: hypothetical protein EBR82_27230 [Caulobacteraceae bacterium]|nr:hypothetical protein [Caulobacteraceae bacterium]